MKFSEGLHQPTKWFAGVFVKLQNSRDRYLMKDNNKICLTIEPSSPSVK